VNPPVAHVGRRLPRSSGAPLLNQLRAHEIANSIPLGFVGFAAAAAACSSSSGSLSGNRGMSGTAGGGVAGQAPGGSGPCGAFGCGANGAGSSAGISGQAGGSATGGASASAAGNAGASEAGGVAGTAGAGAGTHAGGSREPGGGSSGMAGGSGSSGAAGIDGSAGTSGVTGGGASGAAGTGGTGSPLKTMFLIIMESRNWSDIDGATSAPYINTALVPATAHAEAYMTPSGNHAAEPNYVWLEAGSNMGITADASFSTSHQSTSAHLTALLEARGVTWKAYAEGPDGSSCPLSSSGSFIFFHTPQLIFDDMTDSGSATSGHCISHVRPHSELQTDLDANHVAQYNVISPSVCNSMRGGTACPSADLVKAGDTWLSKEIPMIMASQAYADGGVIFVAWDQGSSIAGGTPSDGPLPFFAVSRTAKKGYAGNVAYDHSALLRTIQEIFSVTPYLGSAASSQDLSDLFTSLK